jgi:ABC-type amino acid transport substrate-binding protein
MRWLLLLPFLLATSLAQALELRIALGEHDALRGEAARTGGQSGDVTAFNEELAREICRRINARCTTVNITFAEILSGVEAKRFDLGFGNFLKTAEREQRVAFSDPIWRSSSRLLARPATAQVFAKRLGQEVSLDNLRNARLVVIAESQQHIWLQKLAAGRGLSLLTAKTMTEVFAMLREDRADFSLLPMLSAYAVLSGDPVVGLEFVGRPVTEGTLGGTVHIALPKDDAVLRQSVNQAMAAMRADGTYHRIVRRYFPFNLD